MLKRDSLMAQMQQLSHTLAKVKRLIVEDELDEAAKAIGAVLADYYGTGITDLVETPAAVFRQQLSQQRFAPEELARLADFLDLEAQIESDPAVQRSLWQKVIVLYDVLEEEHQTVSFDHILRRAAIRNLIGGEES